MDIYGRLAQLVTRHPRLLVVSSSLLVAGSLLVALFGCRFDSEILNMLPGNFESVQTLKLYNNHFTDARQLTFLLLDPARESDLEGFRDHFARQARKQPWALRVLARSPMEDPEGLEELKAIVLPLLMNIQPQEFSRLLQRLEPERLRQRLRKYHAAIESGSPRAEIELSIDPLGIVFAALKPLWGTFTEDQADPLCAPDGTARLILVATNLEDMSPPGCQAMMRQVEAFKRQVVANWPGQSPQILVTGRTAYVAEMSQDMRRDITLTVISSMGLVGFIFYIGFRRTRPLGAILYVLILSCVAALGIGGLIFRQLSMISIGCCSILIGLGVDFGMLLYGSYQMARNTGLPHDGAITHSVESLGRSVLFGALTTAAGFLTLNLSECSGFAQLGTLIALGVLFSAFFMMTLFFLLLGKEHRAHHGEWGLEQSKRYIGWMADHSRAILMVAGSGLALLTLIGFGPVGRLQFRANPRSLEPQESKAGLALRTIQSKMPAAEIEPVLVISQARDCEDFQRHWNRLSQAWQQLKAEGKIKNFTSPAPFALSPKRIRANSQELRRVDFPAIQRTLKETLAAEGFSEEAFQGAFTLLAGLQAVAAEGGPKVAEVAGAEEAGGGGGVQEAGGAQCNPGALSLLDWKNNLPQQSPWWFLINRFFSLDPRIGAAYVTPNQTISTTAQQEALRKTLNVEGIPIRITGWSYALAELAPWSKQKLWGLSTIMVLLNILFLIFLYRAFYPILILILSLLLSIGAMVACLKLFALPLNLFNVLAFPMVLGVGVDYGIYLLLALRQPGDRALNLSTVMKPVLMSGLTTLVGFGSLGLAKNPSLSGLGILCALGVAWSLLTSFFFILPAYLLKISGK